MDPNLPSLFAKVVCTFARGSATASTDSGSTTHCASCAFFSSGVEKVTREKTRRGSQSDTEVPSLLFPHNSAEHCKSFLQGMPAILRTIMLAAPTHGQKGVHVYLAGHHMRVPCKCSCRAATCEVSAQGVWYTWPSMHRCCAEHQQVSAMHALTMQPVASWRRRCSNMMLLYRWPSTSCQSTSFTSKPVTTQSQAQHPLRQPLHMGL